MHATIWTKPTPPRKIDGLGEVTGWQRWYADPKEIYLWRAQLAAAEIDTVDDAKLLVSAVAHALNPDDPLVPSMKLDVRGLTIGYLPSGQLRVDVVLSADSTIPYVAPTSASSIATRVMSDTSLRQRFPQASVEVPQFLQLTGPPASVDFWKAQSILYDDVVGPLDAYAEGQGIFRGQADDGPSLEPLEPDEPAPIGPGRPKHEPRLSSGATTALVGLATMALAYAGARLISEPRR